VRGTLADDPIRLTCESLFARPLEALSAADMAELVRLGLQQGLRLHRFKRTMELPRVRKVLGILRGIQPREVLDIGSGRGAFLWPLLDALPGLPVTAVDRLPHRVADIETVRRGGVRQVSAREMDATTVEFEDSRFDLVTLLEVLEHIPDAGRALAEACRVARRFVILSVPSKADDNPEHIHEFDRATLQAMLEAQGARQIKLDSVLNHWIVVARFDKA
jgi:ubiquinone/menaquinone biosynthesis C-methylase UbiE